MARSKSAMARSLSPLDATGRAAVVVGDVEVRIEPDRLIEVGDGAVRPGPWRSMRLPRSLNATAIARVELDRRVEVRHRAVEIPLLGERAAAAVQALRVVRIELDRGVEVLDRAVDVALAA